MASVIKREWTTKKGVVKKAFRLHWVGLDGKSHRKQFPTKGAADAEKIRIEGEMARGHNPAAGLHLTVGNAADAFLADKLVLVQQGKRVKSTERMYESYIRNHIKTHDIAKTKLAQLTSPECLEFARHLEETLSDATGPRIYAALGRVLKFAKGKGWISYNPSEDIEVRTKSNKKIKKLQFQLPSKDSLQKLILASQTFDLKNGTGYRAQGMVAAMMFGGLRISETRGLHKGGLLTNLNRLSITQRADHWQNIGPVKSASSVREVPIGEYTLRVLRLCAIDKKDDDLLFPNAEGRPENPGVSWTKFWMPLMADAGLVDDKGSPVFGFHMLRHVAVSLWIEQGASQKQVSTWAGHSSIAFTIDVYGHLWDDPEKEWAISAATEDAILKRNKQA